MLDFFQPVKQSDVTFKFEGDGFIIDETSVSKALVRAGIRPEKTAKIMRDISKKEMAIIEKPENIVETTRLYLNKVNGLAFVFLRKKLNEESYIKDKDPREYYNMDDIVVAPTFTSHINTNVQGQVVIDITKVIEQLITSKIIQPNEYMAIKEAVYGAYFAHPLRPTPNTYVSLSEFKRDAVEIVAEILDDLIFNRQDMVELERRLDEANLEPFFTVDEWGEIQYDTKRVDMLCGALGMNTDKSQEEILELIGRVVRKESDFIRDEVMNNNDGKFEPLSKEDIDFASNDANLHILNSLHALGNHIIYPEHLDESYRNMLPVLTQLEISSCFKVALRVMLAPFYYERILSQYRFDDKNEVIDYIVAQLTEAYDNMILTSPEFINYEAIYTVLFGLSLDLIREMSARVIHD